MDVLDHQAAQGLLGSQDGPGSSALPEQPCWAQRFGDRARPCPGRRCVASDACVYGFCSPAVGEPDAPICKK
eukprot:9075231-Alexandrium_andersonii.AAC.1